MNDKLIKVNLDKSETDSTVENTVTDSTITVDTSTENTNLNNNNDTTNSNAPLTLNHTQQVSLTDKEILNHTQQVSQTQKDILNHTKQAEVDKAVVTSKDIEKIKRQILEKKAIENSSALKSLLIMDLVLAMLTTFFFSSNNVAYISFSIYTFTVSYMLYDYLNKHNLVVNKSSFLWLVPINLIAFSNALFYTNTHGVNIFIVHLLFGLMLIKVTNSNFTKVYDLSLLRQMLSNFIPHIYFSGAVLDKVIFTKTDKKAKSSFVHVGLGVLVALPVLFIVLAFLGEADANFEKMQENLFSLDMGIAEYLQRFAYFVGASIIFIFYSNKIFYTKEFLPKETKKLNINPITVSTFLVLLNIVYVLFLYLQAQYVFTDGLFALPSDFTYAEYARDGFFPTFNVTVINLCLITFIVQFTTVSLSNRFLKTNFIIMFVSNILLIFNALNRMYLYIATYGYTTLRQLPTLALLFILVLMILLGLYVVRKINFFKYAVISFVVFYVFQAYTCNDVVSTHLNFNKFNITYEDFTVVDKADYSNYYFAIMTSDGHVIDFERNLDTYWYFSKVNQSIIEVTPAKAYSQTAISNYYGWNNVYYYEDGDTYKEVYEKSPFYSKTFLQIGLEKVKYE